MSKRLHEKLAALKAEGRAGLVPFFSVGDPDLDTSRRAILAAAEAGADVIELGVPFSDPIADGTVIQESSQRALAAGSSLARVLEMIDRGELSPGEPQRHRAIVHSLLDGGDHYMLLADYAAYVAAQAEIERSGALEVPLRLRNAATKAMAEWGYGDGYRDPQKEDGFVPERYLPEALGERVFYEPTQRGTEVKVAEHLAKLRARAAQKI